jgi:hypothetical protein
MRRIVTAISAAALSLSMVATAMPAAAATGFDSTYAGESAFLTLGPGQSGTFTVFFANVGTLSWVRGTSTQVDLAACLDDKVTCNNQDASEAGFNDGTWVSATRYTTQTQTAVAPGSVATFSYNVKVPTGATGTHHFNGAVVVSGTGADVHNEGYFQDVTVVQVSCTPTTITTTPVTKQETVGATHTQTATVTCANGAGAVGAEVTFAVQTGTNSLNQNLVLKAVTDASGQASVTWSRSNPDVDSVSIYPTLFPIVRATATVQWVINTVITCSPTTPQNAINGTSVIFTLTVRDPKTGALVGAGNTVSIGVKTAVTRGTASISSSAGTVAADQTTNANATAGTQLNTTTTDGNGNATFTVNGTGSVITPVVWLESASFGGNADTTKDTSEFQAECAQVTFAAVQSATLTVTSSTSGSVAQGGQRVYTVTATDASGNAVAVEVNIGFVERLLTTAGTSAVVVWYDIRATATDQRTAAVTTPSRQSACDQVPDKTYDANSRTQNTTGNTITAGATVQQTFFTLPAIGRATFAVCSTAVDAFTPLAWQDVEQTPDRIPQNGEPQAQGPQTTSSAAVLTSGLVNGRTGNTSAETDPTSASDAQAQTKTGSGLEQFTFYMRNQSNNGFFTTNAQTVLWTIQNTGGANVYIVDFDGSATTTPITITPGQSRQVQSPIAASASNCNPGGVDNPSGSCHDSASLWLNAAAATTATITGTLISGGATGTATKKWVAATAEPAGAFQATGTVVAFNTTQKFYLLQTTAGTFVKITYTTHTTDSYQVLGTSVDLATFESFLKVGDTIEYKNDGAGGGGPNAGNATHKITAVPSS